MTSRKLDPQAVARDIRRRVRHLDLSPEIATRAEGICAALLVAYADQPWKFDVDLCAALGFKIAEAPMGGWCLESADAPPQPK